jgi:hypothetical protein
MPSGTTGGSCWRNSTWEYILMLAKLSHWVCSSLLSLKGWMKIYIKIFYLCFFKIYMKKNFFCIYFIVSCRWKKYYYRLCLIFCGFSCRFASFITNNNNLFSRTAIVKFLWTSSAKSILFVSLKCHFEHRRIFPFTGNPFLNATSNFFLS